ncbi:MAG: phytoene/squalene synthase family protein [Bacteroidota bacterium]
MKELFDSLSARCSKLTTNKYSTSFSIGIRLLHEDFRKPIYAIYGFVRLADEIVDSFHEYDKAKLLEKLTHDTYAAIEDGISLNPILNSFQFAVREYKIEPYLIETFLKSMEMDLYEQTYTREEYESYILGSAEVVGLMCLRVFTDGDTELYEMLKPYAMKLGAAFQKINFLRDMKADFQGLGRTYFPNVDMTRFDETTKASIEREIREDFYQGYLGIKQLPAKSRFGVYVAYRYYLSLFKKIKQTPSAQILTERIRIPNEQKYALFVRSFIKHRLHLI